MPLHMTCDSGVTACATPPDVVMMFPAAVGMPTCITWRVCPATRRVRARVCMRVYVFGRRGHSV